MYRAYDTMLQVSVSAHEAARNGDEYYRYECLCCGEEVYIAAAYSHYQSTHFRHRRGNNNKRCEKYMGQIGVHSSSIHRRKSCFERADFVFNPKLQTLNVFICLDDHELDYYAGQDATFECRTGYSSSPIIALKINRMNFAAQKRKLPTGQIAFRILVKKDRPILIGALQWALSTWRLNGISRRARYELPHKNIVERTCRLLALKVWNNYEDNE